MPLETEIEPPLPNGDAYEKARTRLDTPMTVLAVAFAAIYFVEYFAKLSDDIDRWLAIATYVLWGIFILEYLLLMWLAEDKRRAVGNHKLDLVLILLPMLRPLRVLRAIRAFAGLGAVGVAARNILSRRGMDWFLLGFVGVVMVGAAAVWQLERREPDALITTFGEALWWAIVTCTTVGYGDETPVSGAGRVVAVVLMLVGIGMLSIITANIAAIFVESDIDADPDRDLEDQRAIELELQVRELDRKLDQVLARLGATPNP